MTKPGGTDGVLWRSEHVVGRWRDKSERSLVRKCSRCRSRMIGTNAPLLVSDDDLRKLGVTREGLAFIKEARKDPSRRVGFPGTTAVSTRFASDRMGVSIQAESSTVELAFLLEAELNLSGDHLETWDQLPVIHLEIIDRNGHRRRVSYTGDYLSIQRSGCYVAEPRAHTKLLALVRDRPSDWAMEGGRFTYLPALNTFERLGLKHVVISSQETNVLRMENLLLLRQAKRWPYDMDLEALARKARTLLRDTGPIPLARLLAHLRLTDATPILWLVAKRELFSRLDIDRLDNPASAWIAAAEPALAQVTDVVRVAPDILHPPDLSQLDLPSLKEIARITERRRSISPGHCDPATRKWSERTLRRRRKALAAANGDPSGLKSGYSRCGRRGPRTTRTHRALIRLVWKLEASPKRMPPHTLFKLYVAFHGQLVSKRHLDPNPVCFDTFKRYRPATRKGVALAHSGRRAERAAEPATPTYASSLPASRPFKSAHADHTRGKIWTVVGQTETRLYLALAWVSILMDSCSKALLAFTLSYAHPSRYALGRLLRDCYRRWGRLPEKIVSDGGSDFMSAFWERTLAYLGIDKGERLESSPRWGELVEAEFNCFEQAACPAAPGNIVHEDRKRGIAVALRGQNQAAWTLVDLYRHLETYQHYRNKLSGGVQNRSPEEHIRDSLRSYSCCGIPVRNREKFAVLTSVPIYRRPKIDPVRGIELGNFGWYGFKGSSLVKAKRPDEEPRIDCETPYIAYARVQGEWRLCTARKGLLDVGISDDAERLARSITNLEAGAVQKLFERDKDAALGRLIQATDFIGPAQGRPEPPQAPPDPLDAEFLEPLAEPLPYEVTSP